MHNYVKSSGRVLSLNLSGQLDGASHADGDQNKDPEE
jgi:hypothetical protein